ncbi:MAG: choice-of-anchor J domain-containing protein [Calditrichaeota bacterium]|nr:choice-of-anchor J domain-containing protein [Calditrichota bacterium]MCB9369568.1 choice-of-anchor J domain-containing protein [Calditrichota bacterium]
MQKFAKLFVLALCLIVVGTAFAGKVKGPDARLVVKNGAVIDVTGSNSNYELPAVGSRRAGTLDEIVLSENFDAIPVGSLPAGWVQIDVDGGQNTVETIWPIDFSQWLVFDGSTVAPAIPGHSGTKFACNIYNVPASANDDYLVLPQQNLTGDITLTFWAASASSSWLESFEVKVSTTDTQPASFSNLIGTQHLNIPATWTQYTFDLSAYAGSPFYVAIHHISNDKLLILVDDVVLEAGEAGPTGFVVGMVEDSETSSPLQGVMVAGGGHSTTTDGTGAYTLEANVGMQDITFSLTGYETYVEQDVNVTDGGTTTLDVMLTALPASNDNCDSPTMLELGDTGYSTLEATIDASIAALPASCNEGFGVAFGPDIWFNFIAPTTGEASFSLCGQADYDTRMAIYTNGTSEVADCPTTNDDFYGCNDDGVDENGVDCLDFTSRLVVDVVEGQSYLLRVGGYGTESGTGTLTVTVAGSAVDDGVEGVPTDFAFQGAFPNPFNPSTQLKFDVPVTADVSLKIYNSLGQEVATLVNGLMNAGSYTVEFAANDLPSGLYFAQLHSGSFTSTQKLVLMK